MYGEAGERVVVLLWGGGTQMRLAEDYTYKKLHYVLLLVFCVLWPLREDLVMRAGDRMGTA